MIEKIKFLLLSFFFLRRIRSIWKIVIIGESNYEFLF